MPLRPLLSTRVIATRRTFLCRRPLLFQRRHSPRHQRAPPAAVDYSGSIHPGTREPFPTRIPTSPSPPSAHRPHFNSAASLPLLPLSLPSSRFERSSIERRSARRYPNSTSLRPSHLRPDRCPDIGSWPPLPSQARVAPCPPEHPLTAPTQQTFASTYARQHITRERTVICGLRPRSDVH